MTNVVFTWKQLDGISPYKETIGVVEITPLRYTADRGVMVTDAPVKRRVVGSTTFVLPPNPSGTFYRFELQPREATHRTEYRLVPDTAEVNYIDLDRVDENSNYLGDITTPLWVAELNAIRDLGGVPGPSAYEEAVLNGFVGTASEWLASLKGDKGDEGMTAYEVARVAGFSGTMEEWLKTLKGETGDSAYDIAVEKGFVGTVDEWISSLKGDKGDAGFSAYQLAKTNGFVGTVDEWLKSLIGPKGDPGYSAYDLAKINGFSGTVQDWLESLIGPQGDPGISAYRVAKNAGYSGTESEWLASLKGDGGEPGLTPIFDNVDATTLSPGSNATVDFKKIRTVTFPDGRYEPHYELTLGLPAGRDAPLPSITVGKVEKLAPDANPTASISGDAPNFVMDLGLVQGQTGNPTKYLLVGPGRPDVPSSTAGIITGGESVGATYHSEDGAGVGAYVWRKRPRGAWVVVDGDTGWRGLIAATTGMFLNVRRTPDGVFVYGGFLFTGGGTRPVNGAQTMLLDGIYTDGQLPVGFRPDTPTQAGTRTIASLSATVRSRADQDPASSLGTLYVNTDNGDSRTHGRVVMKTIAQGFGGAIIEYPTLDPWPSTLPGTPA